MMRKRRSVLAILTTGLMAAGLLTACGGSAGSGNTSSATFAGSVGEPPTYFFPMYTAAYWDTGYVPWASYLSWRPLYLWGNDGRPSFNPKLSLAETPKWSTDSKGDTVAQITLKPMKWSDGKPITTRDVQFWMNLLAQEKVNWAPYVPGAFPDNVKSIAYDSKTQFTITMKGGFSHAWLLGNEFDQITPIPQAVWDKTSATGKVGNYDMTPSGAKKVYGFLQAQAKKPATFQSSPLWKVVDGPWEISSYNVTTSQVSYKPNPDYPFPVKQHLKTFTEVPYTSDTAELDALENGSLDVGYVPLTSLSAIPALERHGYKIADWTQDSFGGLIFQYAAKDPATPILKQLYIRQAMTHLIDINGIIKKIWNGKAGYVSGPVPNPNGEGTDVAPAEKSDPYPFSVSAAKSLLTSHGWDVKPNGVSTCVRAGTAANECGAGIKQGAPLSFRIVGTASETEEFELLQLIISSYSQVGMKLKAKLVPEGNLATVGAECTGKSTCPWDMALWMQEWPLGWTPYLETGENTWETGATSNLGNTNIPSLDKLIEANFKTANNAQALETWEDYMVKQQLQIFLPIPVYRVVAYKSNLQGVTPLDPYLGLYPENWHYSK